MREVPATGIFNALPIHAYVTLCSPAGTSLLLCIQVAADNIKWLGIRGQAPLAREGVIIAGIHFEPAGLCPNGGSVFAWKPRQYSGRDWMAILTVVSDQLRICA